MKIKIGKMNVTPKQLRHSAATRLATFEAYVGGIRLAGCGLLQYPDGRVIALPPIAKSRTNGDQAISFTSTELRDTFVEAALEAYNRAVSHGPSAGVARMLADEVVEETMAAAGL